MIKLKLIIIIGFISIDLYSQNIADSLYQLAWAKHNNAEYEQAAILFEQSSLAGKNGGVVYLNTASSWAYADNEEKVFENLHKMIDANYLDKDLILNWFSEFYKYHETNKWKDLMLTMDNKQNMFYDYAKEIDFQELTKEQMYQDFDSLINKLKTISPHLKVKEVVCNLDYTDYYQKLRKEIEFCNSAKDFALVLYKALIVCQDGHTSFTSFDPFEHLGDGKSREFCASIAKYEMLFNQVKVTKTNLPKLVYDKGHYYLWEEFIYNSYKIPIKSELLFVNNLKPSEYILKNIDKTRFLSWDFANKCFYSETFLQQEIASDSIIELTFKNRSKKVKVKINLEIGYVKQKTNSVKNGYISYFENEKILYIRMPRMVNGLFYAEQVLMHKGKEIKKIIIDIRNNRVHHKDAYFSIKK